MSLDFGRVALTMGVAAAMLPGCGGSQPPVGAPGAMPQTRAIATGPLTAIAVRSRCTSCITTYAARIRQSKQRPGLRLA